VTIENLPPEEQFSPGWGSVDNKKTPLSMDMEFPLGGCAFSKDKDDPRGNVLPEGLRYLVSTDLAYAWPSRWIFDLFRGRFCYFALVRWPRWLTRRHFEFEKEVVVQEYTIFSKPTSMTIRCRRCLVSEAAPSPERWASSSAAERRSLNITSACSFETCQAFSFLSTAALASAARNFEEFQV